MGSIFGGGSAKKAAKRQTEAIREQTRLQVQSGNFAAQAAIQQMTEAQQARTNQEYVEDLLGTPVETADVNLNPQREEATGEVLRRRRTTRQQYQSAQAGLSVL